MEDLLARGLLEGDLLEEHQVLWGRVLLTEAWVQVQWVVLDLEVGFQLQEKVKIPFKMLLLVVSKTHLR